jgi:hypothetical protein
MSAPKADPRVEPPCGVYIDACSFGFWHFLPDGTFQTLGKADARIVRTLLQDLLQPAAKSNANSSNSQSKLLTFRQAEPIVGLSRKTLYEWKRTGKLRREHGLRMVGPRSPRLEIEVFERAIANGELSGCSSKRIVAGY